MKRSSIQTSSRLMFTIGFEKSLNLEGWKSSCCIVATLLNPNFWWQSISCTPRWVWIYSTCFPVLFFSHLRYPFRAYLAFLLWCGSRSYQCPWLPIAPLLFLYGDSNGNGANVTERVARFAVRERVWFLNKPIIIALPLLNRSLMQFNVPYSRR